MKTSFNKPFPYLWPLTFMLIITLSAKAQNHGYVQQDNIKVSGITSLDAVAGLDLNKTATSRIFYDGLGRSVQQVDIKGTALQNDIIQPLDYNNIGDQTKTYLPYGGSSTDVGGSFRINALSADRTFYNNTAQNLIARDTAAYKQQVLEASPLQRLLKDGSVGSGFQSLTGQHYTTIQYRPNVAVTDGNILIWNADGTFTANSFYSDNALSVNEIIDEENVDVLTFTDFAGRLILKRRKFAGANMDTYYIYNNAGLLSYVIPPLATQKLAASSYNLNTVPLLNLIFKISYDGRGRVIEKASPGKGTIYIVYDPLNRIVLMQDSRSLASNKWNYFKYDAKNRAISGGIYQDNTAGRIGRSAMQAYVNSLNYSTWYESRSATATLNGYYTNITFPTSSTGTLTPYIYNYFDDYYLTQGSAPDFSYSSQNDTSLPNEETATLAQLKDMPTIVCRKAIGVGLSNTWITSVTFYDKALNVIQVRSNNHLYYNGYTTGASLTDTKTIVNDFTGHPMASKTTKMASAGGATSVYTQIAYDHAYRPLSITQKYNSGSFSKVVSYSYNEAGQVIQKNLQPTSLTAGLQLVDYRYNVKGQITSINNSKLLNDAGVTNADSNDLFGMQLLYEKVDASLGNTPYFNGRISAIKWMSKDNNGIAGYERALKYNYDAVDRYTDAIYAERPTSGTGNFVVTHGWDESGITYDYNGNILTMVRNSSTQGSGTTTQIDNLSYTYQTNNPNQLQSITDGSDANHTQAGFKNITGSTANYSYEANSGNLIADPYKGISSISYNDFNQTDKITLSTTQYINYTYDGGGTLLRKQVYKTGTPMIQTDYVDGFVYDNSSGTTALAYFEMPEGRVRNNGGALVQEFIIKDPQGNARVSLQNNGSGVAVVRQENSYYGYGLVMSNGPVGVLSDDNKKLYNGGAEWQNDYNNLPDYYQTLYRNYDAAIGRFIAVDPEAESSESESGYHYAGNNPISNNDPLGNLTCTYCITSIYKYQQALTTAGYGKTSGFGTGNQYTSFTIDNSTSSTQDSNQKGNGAPVTMEALTNIFNHTPPGYYSGSALQAIIPGGSSYVGYSYYFDQNGQYTGKYINGGDRDNYNKEVRTYNQETNTIVIGYQRSDYPDENDLDGFGSYMNQYVTTVGNFIGYIGANREAYYNTGKWIGANGTEYSTLFRGSAKWISGAQSAFVKATSSYKITGNVLGGIGLAWSSYSYFSKVLNPKAPALTVGQHTSYWVGAVGSVAAMIGGPITVSIVAIYGLGELGSYLYNHKSLEENIIDR